MKIHPREAVVDKAEMALLEWSIKYGLTIGEETMLFSLRISSNAKYQIRQERHGDTSKEGGLE